MRLNLPNICFCASHSSPLFSNVSWTSIHPCSNTTVGNKHAECPLRPPYRKQWWISVCVCVLFYWDTHRNSTKCVLTAFVSQTAELFAFQSKSNSIPIKIKNVSGRLNQTEHDLNISLEPTVFQLKSVVHRVDPWANDHWKIHLHGAFN